MAWQIDRAALVAGRDEAARELAEREDTREYEMLGKAHRWLDEHEPARRNLLTAVAFHERRLAERGRAPIARVLVRHGSLLRLAGESERARAKFEAAEPGQLSPLTAAGVRYLLGDDDGALADAAREDEPLEAVEAFVLLVRARSGRDAGLARKAADVYTVIARSERLLPSEVTGFDPLGWWEGLEEAFRLEAEFSGAPAPDHLTLLDRAGLLKS